MKKVAILALSLSLTGLIFSCGGGSQPQQTSTTTESNETQSQSQAETQEKKEHDAKGIGPITEVALSTPLDKGMVKKGQEIYDLKCSSCHKLDNTKLVGPGWKGVTGRRKPEWIMNFVTNVDEMLNKDAQAMALLEECLVRMPNQNLSEQDARSVLEFMRHNDGEK